MRISGLRTEIIRLELARPIKTAIHNIDHIGCVLLRLESSNGHVGEAYAFTLNSERIGAYKEMIKGFQHVLIGADPHDNGAIWQQIWQEINPAGHKGVTIAALSTLDTACWDLVGKNLGLPLHKIWGSCRDLVDTYASGGLWLSDSIDELIEQAQGFVEQGFKAIKLRIGKPNINDDIERVRQVRKAVGENIDILTDANQSLSVKQAIRLAKQLQDYGVDWLEEPVPANDLRGHQRITDAVDIRIASGETEYTRYGMQAMIDARACDVLMPDLQRIGGYSEMLKVAHIASAHHLPVSTHIFTEQSLVAAAAMQNCISVEHMPWYEALFNEKMELLDGKLQIPRRPGIGFTFRDDWFQ